MRLVSGHTMTQSARPYVALFGNHECLTPAGMPSRLRDSKRANDGDDRLRYIGSSRIVGHETMSLITLSLHRSDTGRRLLIAFSGRDLRHPILSKGWKFSVRRRLIPRAASITMGHIPQDYPPLCHRWNHARLFPTVTIALLACCPSRIEVSKTDIKYYTTFNFHSKHPVS